MKKASRTPPRGHRRRRAELRAVQSTGISRTRRGALRRDDAARGAAMDAIREGADCCEQPDPLALLRRSAIGAAANRAGRERGASSRSRASILSANTWAMPPACASGTWRARRSAWARSRKVPGLRESGQLPKSVDPKVAAIGTMSLVSGLIANWVLAPRSFSLEKNAETLVDTYFRGLATDAERPKAETQRKQNAEKTKAVRSVS